jgi:hypothetical protein
MSCTFGRCPTPVIAGGKFDGKSSHESGEARQTIYIERTIDAIPSWPSFTLASRMDRYGDQERGSEERGKERGDNIKGC